MTKLERHRRRHIKLHQALDELCADWALHNEAKLFSNTSIMELMRWSHWQTIEPEELSEPCRDS